MRRPSITFAIFEAQARERDLSPSQCRAARELLGIWPDDLADLAGLDVYEVDDFENRDERGGGLSVCERFKIASALMAAGVTFARRGASEDIRIHGAPLGDRLWSDGPSTAQLRAALALLGWDASALADLSGIAKARIEAIASGDVVSDIETALLINAFRAAGARFYRSQRGEGVGVKCRRPWHRAWLENHTQGGASRRACK